MEITPAYLSTKQAAKYLGIGYSTIRRDWCKWTKLGIIPSRYNGNKDLRFKKNDLDKLMDSWRVAK